MLFSYDRALGWSETGIWNLSMRICQSWNLSISSHLPLRAGEEHLLRTLIIHFPAKYSVVVSSTQVCRGRPGVTQLHSCSPQ